MAGDNKWIFSKEELKNTPSRKSNIDEAKEMNYRQQSANSMQELGRRLQVYPVFQEPVLNHVA